MTWNMDKQCIIWCNFVMECISTCPEGACFPIRMVRSPGMAECMWRQLNEEGVYIQLCVEISQ